jgi:hypothetical protein
MIPRRIRDCAALLALLSCGYQQANAQPSPAPAHPQAESPIVAGFIREAKLSPKQASELRDVLRQGQQTFDELLSKNKTVTSADRDRIRETARRRAVTFLSRKQLEDYDRTDSGLLFYRPGPNDQTLDKLAKQTIQQATEAPPKKK